MSQRFVVVIKRFILSHIKKQQGSEARVIAIQYRWLFQFYLFSSNKYILPIRVYTLVDQTQGVRRCAGVALFDEPSKWQLPSTIRVYSLCIALVTSRSKVDNSRNCVGVRLTFFFLAKFSRCCLFLELWYLSTEIIYMKKKRQ